VLLWGGGRAKVTSARGGKRVGKNLSGEGEEVDLGGGEKWICGVG